VGALAMALLSRHILFFAKPAYLSSAPIIPWLLVCLLPVVAAYPASIVLMVERRLWASVVGGVAATAVAAALDLALIPRFSYYGALIASFAGFSVLAAVQHQVAGTWRFLTPGHFRKLPSDLAALVRSRVPH
jgi:O-antigen/teichoic acid export membrane protein